MPLGSKLRGLHALGNHNRCSHISKSNDEKGFLPLNFKEIYMTRILYVEDNEDNIYMLKRWLKRKGFDVSIAEDGQTGVEMAKSEKPDLILMDLNLPIMDGWEATSVLKTDAETKDIPIIALSAHAMTEHKKRALDSGADDYDTKPVDVERLLSKMNRYLGN